MDHNYSTKNSSVFLSVVVWIVLMTPQSTCATTTGKAIYNKACKQCHASGIAGAPVIGDTQWILRLKRKGLEGLVKSVKNGLNAMPAGGMCSQCSESDYKKAIKYMLPKNMPM